MNHFEELAKLIPSGGTVQMALTRKGDTLTVALVPHFQGEDASLSPLSITDTIENLDERFVECVREFAPSVQVVGDTLEQAKVAAEARKAEIAAKAEGAKSKAKGKSKKASVKDDTPAEDPQEARKNGPLDESDRDTLASVPASDSNFAPALKRASKATLEAALEQKITLSNLKRVAIELAKLTDRKSVDIQVETLTAKYKEADNGTKERLGKALEAVSGKTLADLGLAPKQVSMLDLAS
jgi:PRTRC genetic system protein E